MPSFDGGDDFVWDRAVQAKGFGLSLVSSKKRLMATWRSTMERKTPRFRRRFDEALDGIEPRSRRSADFEYDYVIT